MHYLLIVETTVQECDATKINKRYAAGIKKISLVYNIRRT